MTFDEYQKKAASTAIYPNRGSNLVYPALGLAGEAGEVANKIKKIYRDDNAVLTQERREQLSLELGDVLWYVSALCDELRLTMDEVARINTRRLAERYEKGSIFGSGDNR